jgi:hypothetical protein
MFSIKGDTVLDPFLGIGTTMYSAMTAGRNSVGYELDHHLFESIVSKLDGIVNFSNMRIAERFDKHFEFVEKQYQRKGKFKHTNKHYLFPVVMRQERDLIINSLVSVRRTDKDEFEVHYTDKPQEDYVGTWKGYAL